MFVHLTKKYPQPRNLINTVYFALISSSAVPPITPNNYQLREQLKAKLSKPNITG